MDSNGLTATNRIGCHSQTRRAVRSRRYPSRFEKNGARRCLEYIHRSVLFVLFCVSSSHSLVYSVVFSFVKPYLSKWERHTMHWCEGEAEQLVLPYVPPQPRRQQSSKAVESISLSKSSILHRACSAWSPLRRTA
jgi:hypothetical protein